MNNEKEDYSKKCIEEYLENCTPEELAYYKKIQKAKESISHCREIGILPEEKSEDKLSFEEIFYNISLLTNEEAENYLNRLKPNFANNEFLYNEILYFIKKTRNNASCDIKYIKEKQQESFHTVCKNAKTKLINGSRLFFSTTYNSGK
jgi:hypothetical protein